MASFYDDEDFPFPVVRALRALGHDVRTALEAAQANAGVPDEAVVAFATADGRAVLTLNRKHFIHLHRVAGTHADIVACTFDADHVGQADRITDAATGVRSLAGLLIRVNRGR